MRRVKAPLRALLGSGTLCAHLAGIAAAERRVYQPISNQAPHYRWEVVLDPADGAGAGVPFAFDVAMVAGQADILRLGEAFWESNEPVLRAAGYDLKIPVSARPGLVIQELNELRSGRTG